MPIPSFDFQLETPQENIKSTLTTLSLAHCSTQIHWVPIRDEDDTQVDPENLHDFRSHLNQAQSSFEDHGHSHASYTPPSSPPTPSLPPSLPPSPVPSSSMYPSSPPIAVPFPLIGASPPAQHQREKPHLAQPQQWRVPSRTEDIQSPQPPQQSNLSSATLQRSHQICKQCSM